MKQTAWVLAVASTISILIQFSGKLYPCNKPITPFQSLESHIYRYPDICNLTISNKELSYIRVKAWYLHKNEAHTHTHQWTSQAAIPFRKRKMNHTISNVELKTLEMSTQLAG